MNMEIGKTYNFDIYPTAILGSNFKNMKLLAILDADTTRLLNFDPNVMHIKVFPTLPPGSVDDYLGYGYYKFRTETGQTVILGTPWVKDTSVVELSSSHLWVKVTATAEQVNAVRASLTSNGFQVTEVQVGGNV